MTNRAKFWRMTGRRRKVLKEWRVKQSLSEERPFELSEAAVESPKAQ
jgi:hypothetical protein